MRLRDGLGQLTYCLNVHPTESWAEARAALTGPARAVKAAVCPDAPFAVGLRFSARATAELAEPSARADLKALLAAEGFRAVTVNGFPYGPFHGEAVKEAVYLPDWRSPERLAYTVALAGLMADIAPPGETVSLSTAPGAFAPEGRGAEAAMAEMMLRAVAAMVALRERTGVAVALALEPEPCCFLETTGQAVAFFGDWLFSAAAAARLGALTGLSSAQAAEALPRHLGVCLDVCHAAVEFEEPGDSVAALRAAGIPVHKLQLSAALRAPRMDAAMRAALAPFAEPTYLHQVVSRRDGRLTRFADLPEALAQGAAQDGAEWRIHFHVPVFTAGAGPFATTRDALERLLALHARAPVSPHLEVETYTWDVLPPDLRGPSVEADVARELSWVRERLQA
jgi:sugar phosphate isomerase/epimerase